MGPVFRWDTKRSSAFHKITQLIRDWCRNIWIPSSANPMSVPDHLGRSDMTVLETDCRSLVFFLNLVYWLPSQRYREIMREDTYSQILHLLFPNWLQSPGPGKVKAKSQELLDSPHRCRGSRTWAIFSCFLTCIIRELYQKWRWERERDRYEWSRQNSGLKHQASAHMGCWH